MLANDKETQQAMNLLYQELQSGSKLVVFWIGAGASAWAGYPLWQELATQMHSDFSRFVRNYDSDRVAALLDDYKFPEAFQFMRTADPQRYRASLVKTFEPSTSHEATYHNLVKLLSEMDPLFIVTTNVDEELERAIPDVALIQRSDFELAMAKLQRRESFLCKIHGSVSASESMIFCADDYLKIEGDDRYLTFLRNILSDSIVVFLGYGVRDQYVIEQLERGRDERALFGGGMHFVIGPQGASVRPDYLRRIGYVVDGGKGHQGALEVLDLIVERRRSAKFRSVIVTDAEKQAPLPSVYYISDLFPLGTHTTSQTVTATSMTTNDVREIVVGEGYRDGEVSNVGYSALHDLIVGLICFDKTYVNLVDAGKAHDLLGGDNFWRLVENDALGAVHAVNSSSMIFPEVGAWVGGSLAEVGVLDSFSQDGPHQFRTVSAIIRSSFNSRPGLEGLADKLFQGLESKVICLPESLEVMNRVRGALVNPSIRALLGISQGVSLDSIPRWSVFPVLRLAKVVRTAQICEQLGASSTRLLWGSERLASAAFQAGIATEVADDFASYTLAGRFNVDLSELASFHPNIVQSVIAFRDTPIGLEIRREISSSLRRNEGSSLVSAVNSGLAQSISLSLLQKARDQMLGLFIPAENSSVLSAAVWGDMRNGDQRIAQWRRMSREILKRAEQELKVTTYGNCPCGSGEKFRFCCDAALRS